MRVRELPQRMENVQAPVIPVMGELVRQCPGAISLGQGVVYYGPPPAALSALSDFLAEPQNHKYSLVQGISPLLEAIQRKLSSENGIAVDADRQVVVTAGANMGFMNALLAVTDPQDEIILQAPYYFNHEMAIVMADCRPVIVPTDARYQLQPDLIERAITGRTRAVVTISPNNPTGAVYPEEALREVNALCERHGIYHIHDEAYEYFLYGGVPHFSPGSIPGAGDHTISLFSLSKSYGFASWRIGYMVIPGHLLDAVKKIQDTILICPPVVSQYAARGALSAGPPYCREKLDRIEHSRTTMLAALQGIGDICMVPPADGAFYFLLQVKTTLDSMEMARRLVVEHGVAVIPGMAFGMSEGCYLRVAYGALDEATAASGIERLVRGLRSLAAPNG